MSTEQKAAAIAEHAAALREVQVAARRLQEAQTLLLEAYPALERLGSNEYWLNDQFDATETLLEHSAWTQADFEEWLESSTSHWPEGADPDQE